jgi:DsbC/DsbD-like thiol-disulfide interchange protein
MPKDVRLGPKLTTIGVTHPDKHALARLAGFYSGHTEHVSLSAALRVAVNNEFIRVWRETGQSGPPPRLSWGPDSDDSDENRPSGRPKIHVVFSDTVSDVQYYNR